MFLAAPVIQLLWFQDWAKPGPYDQPMVNTLRRKKEPKEAVDTNGSLNGTVPSQPITGSSPPEGARSMNAVPKVSQSVTDAHILLTKVSTFTFGLGKIGSSQELHCGLH